MKSYILYKTQRRCINKITFDVGAIVEDNLASASQNWPGFIPVVIETPILATSGKAPLYIPLFLDYLSMSNSLTWHANNDSIRKGVIFLYQENFSF